MSFPRTIVGNLTKDPKLVEGQNGAIVNFSIADTPRKFDRDAQEWKDEETNFHNCVMFKDPARRFAALKKGDQVIVVGIEKTRKYTPEGETEERKVVEIVVDYAGPTTQFAEVTSTRVQRGQGGGQAPAQPQGQQFQQPAAPQGQQFQQPVAQQPVAQPAPAAPAAPAGGGFGF